MTTLTCYLFPQSSQPSSNFHIPAKKCVKFINTALSASQKETLPSLWNTFLLLTIKGVLSDIQLARKQLLLACKNGFYGNACQISPSVLPLLARIWTGISSENDTTSKEEFAHDIIKATIQGYGTERSLIEKGAIAKSLVETLGFLCKHSISSLDMAPIYAFIYSNLAELSNDNSKLFGTLVKDQGFYDGLIQHGAANELLNSKYLGSFIVGVCFIQPAGDSNVPGPSSFGGGGIRKVKKSVKFADPDDDSSSSNNDSSSYTLFETLTDQKQAFIQSFVKTCVERKAFKPIAVLSRTYRSEKIWKDVNTAEIDVSNEEDKITRLQLALELVQVFPENPAVLGRFSDEFENFEKNPSDFKIFLKELDSFTHLQPIKRWIRMNVFTTVVERLITSGDLSEGELQTILKFILRDSIFPTDFTSHIVSVVKGRLETDPGFFDNVSHILSSSSFKTDLSQIYEHFWELYFLRSVSLVESDLELIETVCFRNLGKLSVAKVAEILEKYLESCEKPKQIDVLIGIAKRLEFTCDMLGPLPKLNVKAEVLSFIGESYAEVVHDILEPVPKFSKVHRAAISKAIFKGKLTYQDLSENSSELDLINPLLNVLYAQAVARVWSDVEKSGYFDKLNQELSDELDVVSSRLIEKIHENKGAWKRLWEELDSISSSSGVEVPSTSRSGSPPKSSDPVWQSRLPLRIIVEYCSKAEIKERSLSSETSTPINDDFKLQVDHVLDNMSRNMYNVKDIIHWITEKRAKNPNDFEFETLFKQTKNKLFMHKLLNITLTLMENLDKDGDGNDETAEEFLGLASCWIAAWLKQTKNLQVNPPSKIQLSWISNLAKGVKIIGQKARNLNELCPKFVQEYVEFHSSQLYPVVYALYLQLNQEVPSHSFWTIQALFYVSSAIVAMPSNTLAFIEPDSVKSCEIFGTIVGQGVSLACKIAAYRVLRKIGYDRSGEGDLPIIPPVIDNLIKTLHRKKRDRETGEFLGLEEEGLIPYLLVWDAVLKIQQGSNEFATYVR
jgi:hypothetical protein